MQSRNSSNNHTRQISKIIIRGFKSIKLCDIPLTRFNVLIGSNGAGKTNFISAFSLIQSVLLKKLGKHFKKKGAGALFYKGAGADFEIEIELFFGDVSYGFVLILDNGALIIKDEYFGSYGALKYKRAPLGCKTSVARDNGESMWERGTGTELDDILLPILKSQSFCVYHFKDALKGFSLNNEHSVLDNKALRFDAGNLTAFLYNLRDKHFKSYTHIIETIRLVVPYFEDFVLNLSESDSGQILLRWRQNDLDEIFDAQQLSDGTLRFICLSVLLLQPQSMKPDLIIIDEPELGLHPYALTIFSEMVKRFSQKNQLIISTQSPDLLNEFEADDVICVDKEGGGSVFHRLLSKDIAKWQKRGYSLGELWNKNLLGGRLSR